MQLSTNLSILLDSIDLPLTQQLKAENLNSEIDYLDLSVTGKDLKLSFLSSKRSTKLNGELPFTSKLRQEGRIGRILKKILPTVSDDDLRTFVETLQGVAEQSKVQLFTVDGSEIYKYYFIPLSKCTPSSNMYGHTLQASCYQGKANPVYFELFEKNPDKFGLLVVMKDGLLDGRALLIHGKDHNGRNVTVVENIRCNTSKYKALMAQYIKEQGWVYSRAAGGGGPYVQGFRTDKLVEGKQLHHWGLTFDGETVHDNASYCASGGTESYQLPQSEWAK